MSVWFLVFLFTPLFLCVLCNHMCTYCICVHKMHVQYICVVVGLIQSVGESRSTSTVSQAMPTLLQPPVSLMYTVVTSEL